MATCRLRINDRKFTSYEGRYFEELTPDEASGNGWECWFEENDTLVCEATRKYSDGRHTMRYVIYPSGFAEQTLQIGNAKPRVIKKGFVTPKGVKFNTGLLGLSGGNIDHRYAYFRYAELQEFLDKYGITAISHQDPNQLYQVRSAWYGGGESSYIFWTDGFKEYEDMDTGRTDEWSKEYPGTGAREATITIKVTDATWVVVDQRILENRRACNSRILYTLENRVQSLDLSLVLKN